MRSWFGFYPSLHYRMVLTLYVTTLSSHLLPPNFRYFRVRKTIVTSILFHPAQSQQRYLVSRRFTFPSTLVSNLTIQTQKLQSSDPIVRITCERRRCYPVNGPEGRRCPGFQAGVRCCSVRISVGLFHIQYTKYWTLSDKLGIVTNAFFNQRFVIR